MIRKRIIAITLIMFFVVLAIGIFSNNGCISRPDYCIRINADQCPAHKLNSVCGINKGVLMFNREDVYDFTDLYKFIGIDSIRTHDDVFDVSNIFSNYDYKIVHHRVDLYDPINEVQLTAKEFCKKVLQPFKETLEPDYTLEEAAGLLAAGYIQDYLNRYDSYLGGELLVFDLGRLETFIRKSSMQLFGLTEAQVNMIRLGSGDAWLFWHPTDKAVRDIENDVYYRLIRGNVVDAWKAIVDADIEVFFRIGESWNRPTYIDPLNDNSSDWKQYYSLVSAKIIEKLYDIPGNNGNYANIGYAEIWNEPDGRFYCGPYYSDKLSWAEDFNSLFTTMEEKIDDLDIIQTANIGGCGYLNLGSDNGDFSKGLFSLKHLNLQDRLPNFLSFHWYGNPHHYNSNCQVPEHLQRTYVLAGKMLKTRELLVDEYKADTASSCQVPNPRMVISEWNLALPSEADTNTPDETGAFHFPANYWGTFVSAALTWFRYPQLSIERAHLYDGHAPAKSCLFFAAENTYWDLDSDGYSFAVRTPAIAMFLHSGLEDFEWLPVEIRKNYLSSMHQGVKVFENVIDAATTPFAGDPELNFPDHFEKEDLVEVTALAAKKESSKKCEYVIIITNLSDETRSVSLGISGLQRDTAYKFRTLKTNWDSVNEMKQKSILIDGYIDASNRIKPEPDQIYNLFNNEYVKTSKWSICYTDNQGLLADEIHIISRSVVRVEIEKGAEVY